MKHTRKFLLTLTVGVAEPLGAIAADELAARVQGAAKTMDSITQMTAGEVDKVDKDARRVTIKHGSLDSLGMPALTMVFRVKDHAMLNQAKAGDRIAFTAIMAPPVFH